jgi:hypothetical protein
VRRGRPRRPHRNSLWPFCSATKIGFALTRRLMCSDSDAGRPSLRKIKLRRLSTARLVSTSDSANCPVALGEQAPAARAPAPSAAPAASRRPHQRADISGSNTDSPRRPPRSRAQPAVWRTRCFAVAAAPRPRVEQVLGVLHVSVAGQHQNPDARIGLPKPGRELDALRARGMPHPDRRKGDPRLLALERVPIRAHCDDPTRS